MNVSIILILLFVGAISTYFAGDKLAKTVALLYSVVSLIGGVFILNQYINGISTDLIVNWISNPNLFIAFQVDGLSLAMLLLTTALTSIIILSSFGNQYNNSKTFYALVLFMSCAMIGTFLSVDAFTYYIFWELALIPIYFIALIWGSGDTNVRKKAVVKFFIYTLGGSLFMLASFMFLYHKSGGSLMISDLYKLQLSSTEQFWVFLGMFLAYAIKIPIIPFHTWQVNVYQKAPAVGTMLLSGIMLKMGLYSIIRWQLPIAPQAAKTYMPILIGLSIAGVVYGSIVALQQKNIKKLLAYSSLAHVGLIAAGLYTLNLDGLRGAVLQMLAHGLVVVGLFFAAEVIERRLNTQEISKMGGIRILDNKFASMFIIIMLASIALPGTFNFVGEFTLLYSLFNINIWYAIIAGTTIILGAIYMLKMFQQAMLGKANANGFQPISSKESLVFVLIITALIVFGLYSKPITDLITPSLQSILQVVNR